MAKQIAIIGAGLIGRILALECQHAGMLVTLFDRDTKMGGQSCAYAGAGMLAPYAELESSESIIAILGLDSLSLWPQLLQKLPVKVFFQQNGSLVLAHPQDHAELTRFQRSVQFKLSNSTELKNSSANAFALINRQELEELETDLPEIFAQGVYLPGEGQIDNRQLLVALEVALDQSGVNWRPSTEVTFAAPGQVRYRCLLGRTTGKASAHETSDDIYQTAYYDLVIDCRGLGAKADLEQLRGVRGELLVVETPDVKLNRPIRLMHPRHSIYIVPRENNRFIVGATTIESEDKRALTVQSALDLLSAACTIHPGFAEATIVESRVNCRPALANNLPAIIILSESGFAANTESGLIRINGLYRHGFLISPQLAKLVTDYIITGLVNPKYTEIFYTEIFSSEAAYTKEIDAYAFTH